MTSLCSDASSSISSRRRQQQGDSPWERMNEEFKKKDKGSVFCASPWDREEKEKMQREQVLDARRARDQEIAHLESMEERTEKQEEWLRILRLEREFQRRAEEEIREDDDDAVSSSEDSDSPDIMQPEIFHGDKVTVISNERHGSRLVDELEKSSKNSTSSEKSKEEQELALKCPPGKHFIPLELKIPDRDLHQASSGLGNNILQVSTDHNSDVTGNRHSKPPIPAPRPSKVYPPNHLYSRFDLEKDGKSDITDVAFSNGSFDSKNFNNSVSSLAKLEISESSALFCAAENGSNDGRNNDLQQDSWMIEVNSFEDSRGVALLPSKCREDPKEDSRIYENVKLCDYQSTKTNGTLVTAKNGFSCHTLPKSTSSSNTLSTSKDMFGQRNGNSHSEKKFPTMGITSTLTKRLNGFSASDVDILPSLYASSKLRNGHSKDIPSDLADKSPEFKKLWISRPEKLTFQDKIRKFSLQAGEDDAPRDRVKNSRAQREIESKFIDGQKKSVSSVSEVV